MTEPTALPPMQDEIRRALAEVDGFAFDGLEPHDYQRHAAAARRVVAKYVRADAQLQIDGLEDDCCRNYGLALARWLEQDTAAEAQQPDTETPVGYSGKGRVFCVACPHPADENVPLTADDVDHWDRCPSCGRYVVEVARAQQAVRHAPGIAVLCPDCRAKGHAVCLAAAPATAGPRRAADAGQDGSAVCGPAPSQCDGESGEPCANHEREQAHAEGEHCFCGSECDAEAVNR